MQRYSQDDVWLEKLQFGATVVFKLDVNLFGIHAVKGAFRNDVITKFSNMHSFFDEFVFALYSIPGKIVVKLPANSP